jgi:hypothetical protein
MTEMDTEISYSPQGAFEGVIKMKMLRRKERLMLMKGRKFKTNEEGKVEVNSDEGVDLAIALSDLLEQKVTSVSVKHKASGKEFHSLVELEQYQEGDELLNELQGVLMSGMKLGNG